MTQRALCWYDFITINVYWLGINVASGIITPILLPYLVEQFSPAGLKNTYLATIRVITLLVAMGAQPIMGMLSDRSTHPAGRRRPYIVGGTVFNIIFLAIVAASPMFQGAASDAFFGSAFRVSTAFMVLLVGVSLLQVSSNTAHGALQGLIPDLVPENQRGRASGVKSLMELLPTFGIVLVGPLVDSGRVWATAGIMMAAFFICMLVVVFTVRERPLTEKPSERVTGAVLRIIALVAIFGSVRWLAVWVLQLAADRIAGIGLSLQLQVTLVGLTAMAAIAAAIFVGVYLGAWVGIGSEARKQRTFIWWVINRLMFLAGIGSIQGFAQYYLGDVVGVENPATMTTVLMASVAVFLVGSALLGGYLSDRWGRKVLVAAAGLISAAGTCLLLFSKGMTMVMISGFIIGTGAGTFLSTNWALGTDLVPKKESGRYLGISNLAGAGAGIVGVGISGPLADFFNEVQPGLGYLVVFAVFAAMFGLSSLTLVQVKLPWCQSTPI